MSTVRMPASPMLDHNSSPFYPLTSASQVLKSNGNKLEENGLIVADTSDAIDGRSISALFSENILDNSNLANPINQRMQTQYGEVSGYKIDRWRSANKLRVEILDGFCSLTCTSETTANGLSQYIAKDRRMPAGEKITVALEDSVGNIYCQSADVPEDGYINVITNLDEKWYARFYNDESGQMFTFMISVGGNIKVKWVAVYKGEYTVDTMPLYKARTYAQELAECQRYYHVYATEEARPTYGFDCAPPMVANEVSQETITVNEVSYYCNSADLAD